MRKVFVILNPGHGPEDVANRSPHEINGGYLYEWSAVRQVAGLAMKMMESGGIDGWILRDPDDDRDYDIPLTKIAKIANQQQVPFGSQKVFISIHMNATANKSGTWDKPNGTETWYPFGRPLAVNLADVVQRHVCAEAGLRNRGLRYHNTPSRTFSVLRNTDHPACLLECGFMTSQKDAEFMASHQGNMALARGIFLAVQEIQNKGGLDFIPLTQSSIPINI